MHNLVHLLAYLCRTYWLFLEVTLSVLFLFFFMGGEFYLNKELLFEEKAVTCLSPIVLFFSVVQQVFITEVRFNNVDVSISFLLIILLIQALIALVSFRVFFVSFFRATSLSSITKIQKESENAAVTINQSVEGDNINTTNNDYG